MLDFRQPDRFTTGTTGRPGQRVFYLQAAEEGRVVTLRIEKQQVAALADSLAEILADVGEPPPSSEPVDLVEPLAPLWVVGMLGVGYDGSSDRILVAAHELASEPGPPSGPAEASPTGDLAFPDEEEEPETARFQLTRSQAAAFVEHAREVVAAGRPTCLYCGRPRDEEHVCPRMN